jgi:hypothetical protein
MVDGYKHPGAHRTTPSDFKRRGLFSGDAWQIITDFRSEAHRRRHRVPSSFDGSPRLPPKTGVGAFGLLRDEH